MSIATVSQLLQLLSDLLEKAKLAVRIKGLHYLILAGIKYIILPQVVALMYKCFLRGKFIFQGKVYHYFYHPYNCTYRNERAVEIPICWEIVKDARNKGQKILEVGNVLSHYFHVDHDIVDKYEKAIGIINEDVCNFKSSKKYYLIISISTLEHVGFDEEPRDPCKVLRAIENLKSLLAVGGKMVATFPVGYSAAFWPGDYRIFKETGPSLAFPCASMLDYATSLRYRTHAELFRRT
jgi:hypothetical protein